MVDVKAIPTSAHKSHFQTGDRHTPDIHLPSWAERWVQRSTCCRSRSHRRPRQSCHQRRHPFLGRSQAHSQGTPSPTRPQAHTVVDHARFLLVYTQVRHKGLPWHEIVRNKSPKIWWRKRLVTAGPFKKMGKTYLEKWWSRKWRNLTFREGGGGDKVNHWTSCSHAQTWYTVSLAACVLFILHSRWWQLTLLARHEKWTLHNLQSSYILLHIN